MTVNGLRIKEAREARGVSRDHLAQRLGIPPRRLKHWEMSTTVEVGEREMFVLMGLDFPARFFTNPGSPHDFPSPEYSSLVFHGLEPDDLCAHCPEFSTYLCDYPVRGRQRCNLPLCDRHAIEQGGEDGLLDYCSTHAGMRVPRLRTEERGAQLALFSGD